MADIRINLGRLNKVLTAVVDNNYSIIGETYLVIENINILAEDIDTEATELHFDYEVSGRYGVKDKLEHRFDFIVSSDWNYDYIAGFFDRITLEEDTKNE